MSNQSRVAKVLSALLIAMTSGAIVLMALGSNPPSAGTWSLSAYHRLGPVQIAIQSRAAQARSRWNCIEIFYSGTKAGNINQLSSLYGLSSPEDLNCHFVVCNGFGSSNGDIQPTEKWQNQWAITPDRTWYGSERTIRISLIADAKTVFPTEFQRKRLEELVEELYRKFDILPQNIYYPNDWR
ncbi:MAG: hypothetical protein ACYTBP_00510 [Planctomycetota bacterium]|jgi:hypothetical protein